MVIPPDCDMYKQTNAYTFLNLENFSEKMILGNRDDFFCKRNMIVLKLKDKKYLQCRSDIQVGKK